MPWAKIFHLYKVRAKTFSWGPIKLLNWNPIGRVDFFAVLSIYVLFHSVNYVPVKSRAKDAA
jgi:hypothetical protein